MCRRKKERRKMEGKKEKGNKKEEGKKREDGKESNFSFLVFGVRTFHSFSSYTTLSHHALERERGREEGGIKISQIGFN